MTQFSGAKQERNTSVVNSLMNYRVVRLVRFYPYAGMQVEPEIRRFLFTRFPYSLIYGIDEKTIVVIAVAHQHRQPNYWADRIDNEITCVS